MRNKWPTKEELDQLQEIENIRAQVYDEEPEVICECGEPGFACCCEELVDRLGYWWDGSPIEDSDCFDETWYESDGWFVDDNS